MPENKGPRRSRVAEINERYGRCLELVPVDPNFHEITVGLYVKNGTATVWTYSQKPGVVERIRQVRDQLVALGGLSPVSGTHNQVMFPCGDLHRRPLKFLITQAVERAPDYRHPEGGISIKDIKSPLTLTAGGEQVEGRWVYTVGAEGEARNKSSRIAAVATGFVRYGEMERVGNDGAAFACGQRHDELVRLLMSYARNVSVAEDALEGDAVRGQMTTSTLGFAPPS